MTQKNEQKYKNIPVKPGVYEQAQLLAEATGFGERGLGALIAHLVARELPECSHSEKYPVSIETYPGDTEFVKSVIRPGYFCPVCKRVYARITAADFTLEDGEKLLKAVQGMVEDE